MQRGNLEASVAVLAAVILGELALGNIENFILFFPFLTGAIVVEIVAILRFEKNLFGRIMQIIAIISIITKVITLIYWVAIIVGIFIRVTIRA